MLNSLTVGGLILLALLAVYKNRAGNQANLPPNPVATSLSPTPSPTPRQIILENNIYNYYFFIVDDLTNLNLIYNLDLRQTTAELITTHKCRAAANGGFYTTNYLPLGLFKIDGHIYEKAKTSQLINAYLSVSDTAEIVRTVPENSRLTLQAGPLLLWKGQPFTLNIRQDKPARRITAGITAGGKLIFLSLITPENSFSGPYLTDLPKIVKNISDEENFNLESAVNLDGGSASGFFTEQIRLQELSVVGSLFCLKSPKP